MGSGWGALALPSQPQPALPTPPCLPLPPSPLRPALSWPYSLLCVWVTRLLWVPSPCSPLLQSSTPPLCGLTDSRPPPGPEQSRLKRAKSLRKRAGPHPQAPLPGSLTLPSQSPLPKEPQSKPCVWSQTRAALGPRQLLLTPLGLETVLGLHLTPPCQPPEVLPPGLRPQGSEF